MKIAIINSQGFWSMGWATDPKSQQDVIQSLERSGIEVVTFEVANKAELEHCLISLKSEPCLVWPNAYQVSVEAGSSDTVWLADEIDAHGLAMIGSNATALKNVMGKHRTQALLKAHDVAIPGFAVVNAPSDINAISLPYPLFVKPNDLSTSKGISVNSVVQDQDELHRQVADIAEQFGYPVLVEEFLPGQDITIAVFMTPDKPLILATYYDTDETIYGEGAVLSHEIRLKDWDDGKWLRVVTEPDILAQLEAVVIPACHAVGVDEFTRIDCRMDANGKIKAFDVNGLPGLELPFSTTVWQMIVKMHEHTELDAFDTLIALIVYCACHRHQVNVPPRICDLAETYIAGERS